MDRKKVIGRVILAYLGVCAAQIVLATIGALRQKEQPALPPEEPEKEEDK